MPEIIECGDETIKMYTTEEVTPKSPDDWLWCFSCNRFFQARSLRQDGLSKEKQGCPFCHSAGFGMGVWPWDAWAGSGWPTSADQLKHGMEAH